MAYNRREFLLTSALASTSYCLPRPTLAPLSFSIPKAFDLTILATNWGFVGGVDAFCARAKEDGYDGIEVWVPREKEAVNALITAVNKYDLKLGLLAGAGGHQFKDHFADFKASVKAATALRPWFVNCHSGRDYFTFEENRQFIDYTIEMSEQTNVPIYHETHRARILFAAHITRRYVEAIPKLRLTLDISHWCTVHSSLLQDQKETVDRALSRVNHVHSRVGHAQSPQISDPRAPEWENALDAHFAWWDQVVEYKVKANEPLTMTTEFGPPNYMPTLPFTNQPITDLWAINKHMKDLWRERYKKN